MNTTVTTKVSWEKALEDLKSKLIELGFSKDKFGRWCHTSGFTVWLTERSFRFSPKPCSKGEAISGLGFAGSDIRTSEGLAEFVGYVRNHVKGPSSV